MALAMTDDQKRQELSDDYRRLTYWLAFKNRPAGQRWREKMKKGKKRLEGATAREGWGL